MTPCFDENGITLYQGDCVAAMSSDRIRADIVLTSPPYNTSRPNVPSDMYCQRYDTYQDSMSNEDYISWTLQVFSGYDRILNPDGVVLYNISYGSENTEGMWLLAGDIIRRSLFTIADCLVWKKATAIPNNVSPNKLTRIVEYVLVCCRKREIDTFMCNKAGKPIKTGQIFYDNIYNFIEARNNDGEQDLNKAAYSTELCQKLLNIYALPGTTVFDSFSGTGTTLLAAWNMGLKAVGTEMSGKQCEYAADRLRKAMSQPQMFRCEVVKKTAAVPPKGFI